MNVIKEWLIKGLFIRGPEQDALEERYLQIEAYVTRNLSLCSFVAYLLSKFLYLWEFLVGFAGAISRRCYHVNNIKMMIEHLRV